eukprot:5293438-Amphidinium_carterae.2
MGQGSQEPHCNTTSATRATAAARLWHSPYASRSRWPSTGVDGSADAEGMVPGPDHRRGHSGAGWKSDNRDH